MIQYIVWGTLIAIAVLVVAYIWREEQRVKRQVRALKEFFGSWKRHELKKVVTCLKEQFIDDILDTLRQIREDDGEFDPEAGAKLLDRVDVLLTSYTSHLREAEEDNDLGALYYRKVLTLLQDVRDRISRYVPEAASRGQTELHN